MSAIIWSAIAIGSAWFVLNLALYGWRARVLRALRGCDRPALPWLDSARAFVREVFASAVALLSVPFDWIPQPTTDNRSPITDHRIPITDHHSPGSIILIHDFGLNAGSFWLLARRLRRSGWRTVVMRHGALRTDARVLGTELRALIEAVAASSPRQIVLLGHGFGGLIARLYGRDYGPLRVHRIVTLGTPHRGSVLTPLHGPLRPVLQPGGRLVTYLEAGDPVPQQFDVINLLSTFDAFVLPPANGEYPGTFNIQINDVGHDALLLSAKVFKLVEENLVVPVK